MTGRTELRLVTYLLSAFALLSLGSLAMSLHGGSRFPSAGKILVAAVYIIACYYLWRGSNVARIALSVLSGIGAVAGLAGLAVLLMYDGEVAVLVIVMIGFSYCFVKLTFSRALRNELAARRAVRSTGDPTQHRA